jgi:hypothetical protein
MKKIIILTFVFLVLFSCARKDAEVRWILLNAPYLMNEDEPGTGTPYLRAPLSDWKQLGDYTSFQECAAAISSPHNDPNHDLHHSGKLSLAERALGFACVKNIDERLLSPPPYDWMTAAKEER